MQKASGPEGRVMIGGERAGSLGAVAGVAVGRKELGDEKSLRVPVALDAAEHRGVSSWREPGQ